VQEGDMAIANYRIYELDPADHILTGYTLVCGSDADALIAAHRLRDQRTTAVEVWESARFVAHPSADEPYPTPTKGRQT
jgi:hypothetical protein